jgi:hypothetical protein
VYSDMEQNRMIWSKIGRYGAKLDDVEWCTAIWSDAQ